MKQLANTKTILAGCVLAGLVVILASEPAWAAAGILGLAVLQISAILPQPRLAPVRIRSQKRRSGTSR